MENSARLFNCARCKRPVRICTHCDRGNIYCGPVCSEIIRQYCLQEAGKRYQNSRQGKFKHAARQQRYRGRHKIVTHHTMQDSTFNDSLFKANEIAKPMIKGEPYCNFCGKHCSVFSRIGFLRSHLHIAANVLPIWPNGP